jgi:hypothetical protein
MRKGLAVVLLSAVAFGSTGCLVWAPQNFGVPLVSGVEEQTLEEADSVWTREKIAVINVDGQITTRAGRGRDHAGAGWRRAPH